MSNEMTPCNLCFDTSDKLINIISTNDRNIGIKRIIEKCFTFMDPLTVLTEICAKCWIKFEIFLEFCEKIREIHENRNENTEFVFVSNSNSGYELIKTEKKYSEDEVRPVLHEEVLKNRNKENWQELNSTNTCWSSDTEFEVNDDGDGFLSESPVASEHEEAEG